MRSLCLKTGFRFILLTALYYFLLAWFTPTLAQETSTERIPDNTYGPDGYKIVTKYPDGTTTTVKYRVEVINGKRIETKWESYKEVVTDAKNGQKTAYDTVYQKDGTTFKAIIEVRLFDGKTIFKESRNYDETGKVERGSREETGYDGKKRFYEFDPQKQEFNLAPTRVQEPISCPIPKSVLFAGYSFASRDNGGGKDHYNGVEVAYSWLFRNNKDNSTDSFSAPRVNTQVGIGASAMYVFFKEDEQKFDLTTVTAGPEVRMAIDRFLASIHVQAGIAREGYKFGDLKDHGNSFALNAGASIEWYFNDRKRFGVAVRPHAMMTNFNDQTDWNFVGSAGIAWRMGCNTK